MNTAALLLRKKPRCISRPMPPCSISVKREGSYAGQLLPSSDDPFYYTGSNPSPNASLAAEVLFLRKELAFYQECKIKPRRFDDDARPSASHLPNRIVNSFKI